jgi:hypothetical protein
MEASEHVLDLVNNRAETRGFLATADTYGKCDAACFSSLRLADRSTMTVTMSPNRSLSNLKANPNAAFVVTRGNSIEDVDGCRVYLLVREIIESGPALEEARQAAAEQMGEEAAKHIKAVVTFDITETRPIIDMGQSA